MLDKILNESRRNMRAELPGFVGSERRKVIEGP